MNGGISGDIFQESYEKVIEYFNMCDNALEIDPENKYAWFNRGILFIHLEKYREAITSFEKALEVDPEYKDAWERKAFALSKLEYYEEAIECYKKVLKIDPEKTHVWYDIGEAEYNLNVKARDPLALMHANVYEDIPG